MRSTSEIANATPLFVIGMPRSGTKLLRTIMNNHSQVGMVWNETEFLPNWISKWEQFGDLSVKTNFDQFYDHCLSYPYFQNQRRKKTLIQNEDWFGSLDQFDLETVFKGLVLRDMGDKRDIKFWGDKSPGYTRQIRTLFAAFPNARFVHITRDVRDYAISVRKAWGKSLLRAAQDWKEGLAYVRGIENDPDIPIYSLKYEDMTQSSESCLQGVCDFLNIPFEPSMLTLDRTVESIGDTKGAKSIVSSNVGKYESVLSKKTVRGIESICGETMKAWGYTPTHVVGNEDLSAVRRKLLHIHDATQVVWHSMRRRGLWQGLKYSVLFRLMKSGRLESKN